MVTSPVHIRLAYEEALKSKKDLLSIEMDILKCIKAVENYKNLRLLELKLKDSLFKKTKLVVFFIRKLEKMLPKYTLPEKMRKIGAPIKEIKVKENIHESENIEFQLKEIQRRLENLQRENL